MIAWITQAISLPWFLWTEAAEAVRAGLQQCKAGIETGDVSSVSSLIRYVKILKVICNQMRALGIKSVNHKDYLWKHTLTIVLHYVSEYRSGIVTDSLPCVGAINYRAYPRLNPFVRRKGASHMTTGFASRCMTIV